MTTPRRKKPEQGPAYVAPRPESDDFGQTLDALWGPSEDNQEEGSSQQGHTYDLASAAAPQSHVYDRASAAAPPPPVYDTAKPGEVANPNPPPVANPLYEAVATPPAKTNTLPLVPPATYEVPMPVVPYEDAPTPPPRRSLANITPPTENNPNERVVYKAEEGVVGEGVGPTIPQYAVPGGGMPTASVPPLPARAVVANQPPAPQPLPPAPTRAVPTATQGATPAPIKLKPRKTPRIVASNIDEAKRAAFQVLIKLCKGYHAEIVANDPKDKAAQTKEALVKIKDAIDQSGLSLTVTAQEVIDFLDSLGTRLTQSVRAKIGFVEGQGADLNSISWITDPNENESKYFYQRLLLAHFGDDRQRQEVELKLGTRGRASETGLSAAYGDRENNPTSVGLYLNARFESLMHDRIEQLDKDAKMAGGRNVDNLRNVSYDQFVRLLMRTNVCGNKIHNSEIESQLLQVPGLDPSTIPSATRGVNALISQLNIDRKMNGLPPIPLLRMRKDVPELLARSLMGANEGRHNLGIQGLGSDFTITLRFLENRDNFIWKIVSKDPSLFPGVNEKTDFNIDFLNSLSLTQYGALIEGSRDMAADQIGAWQKGIGPSHNFRKISEARKKVQPLLVGGRKPSWWVGGEHIRPVPGLSLKETGWNPAYDYRFQPLGTTPATLAQINNQADPTGSLYLKDGNQHSRIPEIQGETRVFDTGLVYQEFNGTPPHTFDELSRQIEKAERSRGFKGGAPLVSLAHASNLDFGGGITQNVWCVVAVAAPAGKRVTSKTFLTDDTFKEVILRKSAEIYDEYVGHLTKLEAMQQIVDILLVNQGDLMRMGKLVDAKKVAEKVGLIEKMITIGKFKDGDSVATKRGKMEQLDKVLEKERGVVLSVAENNLSPNSRDRIKEIEERMMVVVGREASDSIKAKAKEHASYDAQATMSQRVQQSLSDNSFKVQLDKTQVSTLVAQYEHLHSTARLSLVSEAAVKDLKKLLDTRIPASPYEGISITALNLSYETSDSFADGSSNTLLVSFNGDIEKGDDTAYVYVRGTKECYIKVVRARQDGVMSFYEDGKLVTKKVTAGQIVMNTGVVYHKGPSSYEPISIESKTFGTSALTKRFGQGNAENIRHRVANLNIVAVSGNRENVTVKFRGKTFSQDNFQQTLSPYRSPDEMGIQNVEFAVDAKGKIIPDKVHSPNLVAERQIVLRDASKETDSDVVKNFKVTLPLHVNKSQKFTVGTPQIEYLVKDSATGKDVVKYVDLTADNLQRLGFYNGDCEKFCKDTEELASRAKIPLVINYPDRQEIKVFELNEKGNPDRVIRLDPTKIETPTGVCSPATSAVNVGKVLAGRSVASAL